MAPSLLTFSLVIAALAGAFAAVGSALAARRIGSAWRAALAACLIAVVVVGALSLWFGRFVSVRHVDSVVGIVLYVVAPGIGLAAAAGSASGLALDTRVPEGNGRRVLLVGLAGIPIAVVSLLVALAAFWFGIRAA